KVNKPPPPAPAVLLATVELTTVSVPLPSKEMPPPKPLLWFPDTVQLSMVADSESMVIPVPVLLATVHWLKVDAAVMPRPRLTPSLLLPVTVQPVTVAEPLSSWMAPPENGAVLLVNVELVIVAVPAS